jgi:hypothetical protein
MTGRTRFFVRTALLVMVAALTVTDVWAQTAPPPGRPAPRNAQRGMRAGGPADAPLNLQNLQNLVDAWALVEAQKFLVLSNEQYPNFVARMTRLQNTRRRHMMERRRLLAELRPLVNGPGPYQDEAISTKMKALDELNQRASQEARQAVLELDGVLSPFQRGRFRMFEEQMEVKKLEFIGRARQGGGAPPPAPR